VARLSDVEADRATRRVSSRGRGFRCVAPTRRGAYFVAPSGSIAGPSAENAASRARRRFNGLAVANPPRNGRAGC